MKKTKQTKFPISRIKKIMQTDEDVGKVAMATPVLVSKALELFIASLVKAGVEQTRATGGKKMTAYHMKRTIQTNDMFDFLLDTVADIADPIEPTPKAKAVRAPRKKKVKDEGGSDDDNDEDEKPAKKPRKKPTPKSAAKVEEEEDEDEDAEMKQEDDDDEEDDE